MPDFVLSEQAESSIRQTQNDVYRELQRAVDALQKSLDILSGKAIASTKENNPTSTQDERAQAQAETSGKESGANSPNDANDVKTSGDWPSPELMKHYKERYTKHRRQCEKMRIELGYFIAHLSIVEGNDSTVIKMAGSVRDELLHLVQCLEKSLDGTAIGRKEAMGDVKSSIDRLDDTVVELSESMHSIVNLAGRNKEWGTKLLVNLKEWSNKLLVGNNNIYDLVVSDQFTLFQDFVYDILFLGLETTMESVIGALQTFEKNFVNEWLAEIRKNEDFKTRCTEYIRLVSPPTALAVSTSTWLATGGIIRLERRCLEHKRACNAMQDELNHLVEHYGIVRGDKEVISAAGSLRDTLLDPVHYLEELLYVNPNRMQETLAGVISSLGCVWFAADQFQKSLYHQKHAFYFRKVTAWVTCLRDGLTKIFCFLREKELNACLDFIYDDLLSDLRNHMVGAPKKQGASGGKLTTVSEGNVAEELKTFGKAALPSFLVEEMERDTTRYVNITTIATFFSSVTATTLQFTYATSGTHLNGVVNLFWFLSLVFSVSSGVNSLLGLTWRKSSIYGSRVTPKAIRLWFDKAPMIFLAIAAITFVVGLNIFSYSSAQPHYVSLATVIFTVLHGTCLLSITAWFLYRLKHESNWATWIRRLSNWAGNFQSRMRTAELWKWIKDLQIWRWTRHPVQEYKKSLHFKRNIYWVLGKHDHVARLSLEICRKDWSREYPSPYRVLQIIRLIAHQTNICWVVIMKAFSDLGKFLSKLARGPQEMHDIEAMGSAIQELDITSSEDELIVQTPADKAKTVYCEYLAKVFGDNSFSKEVMDKIESWENNTRDHRDDIWLKKRFGQLLWGYPDLVEMFYADVAPVLAPVRAKRLGKRRSFGVNTTYKVDADNGLTASTSTSRPPQPQPSDPPFIGQEEPTV